MKYIYNTARLRNFWKVIGYKKEWYLSLIWNLPTCMYFISMATNLVVFWKHGGKVSWMSTWMSLLEFHRSIHISQWNHHHNYPSGFGCIIYHLARENGQDSTTTFMNETGSFASELMHMYCTMYAEILTGANCIHLITNLVMFCWKHGGKVSWMSVNAIYLNSIAMSTFCRWF